MPVMLYEKDFKSRRDEVNAVVAEALDTLEKNGVIDKGDHFSAHLCLEEALVNAVVHGNRENPDLNVRLEIIKNDGTYMLRIHDEGGRFDPNDVNLPEPRIPGGRGICLMKHYMDRVSYDSACHCLEMEFRPKHRPASE